MNTKFRFACSLVLIWSLPAMAWAHHAMGYAAPANAWEGFVSGLAHPVIGVDHLLFVLAAGFASFHLHLRLAGVCAFIVAALAGTLAYLTWSGLPYADVWVAATLIAAGLWLYTRQLPSANKAIGFLAAAGLLHGYAYGEGIVGAEATPIVFYLAGYALVQAGIAAAGFLVARRLQASAIPALKPAAGMLAAGGIASLVLALAA